MTVCPLTGDWDPKTVTWNTKPKEASGLCVTAKVSTGGFVTVTLDAKAMEAMKAKKANFGFLFKPGAAEGQANDVKMVSAESEDRLKRPSVELEM